jgi:DNA-binding NtrC family response regulator
MHASGPYCVLVVEDDPLFARTLRLQLGEGRFLLTFCAHTALALQHLRSKQPDLILLDIHLGGHEEGLVALPKVIAAAPNVPVVVHSVLSDHATVVRAMRQGAHDYIPKHVGIKTLSQQLSLTIEHHRKGLHAQAASSAAQNRAADQGTAVTATPPILGHSQAMATLHRAIAQAQRSQGSVIIHGEAGTGKEWVARAMARAHAPFVAVDAATLEGPLAISALFGHNKGAFTGADCARPGLFEQAHGGVMYFDEVANMSLDVQAKLLRVLQEREVVRVGGTTRRALVFRLVCATHADLAERCRKGLFRFDLLTRMQVFTLTVPPLRERLEDLPDLFTTFVARYSHQDGVVEPSISPTCWQALSTYAWPGNVRELQHAAQYAVAACNGALLAACHLPAHILIGHRKETSSVQGALDTILPQGTHYTGSISPTPRQNRSVPSGDAQEPMDTATSSATGSFYARVRAFERRTLLDAYGQSQGNISAMARSLGMDRSSLYAKLRLYAIHTTRSA